MLYSGLLDLHNLLRWAVVLLAVVAIVSALVAQRWTPAQNSLSRWFSGVFGLQVLVGLVLWFVSDLVQSSLRDMGAAMGDPTRRFFLLEHPLLMIVAVILVGIGGARGRKTDNPRVALVFYLLAAAAMAYAIPWDRPLVPGM